MRILVRILFSILIILIGLVWILAYVGNSLPSSMVTKEIAKSSELTVYAMGAISVILFGLIISASELCRTFLNRGNMKKAMCDSALIIAIHVFVAFLCLCLGEFKIFK